MDLAKHNQRIKDELKSAGMTSYGFLKLSTGYLPNLIHENEHIGGVVYGRVSESFEPVMLVATDRRVLYVDCKPFYRDWDEITYSVVAGVKTTLAGPFAYVTLHTRVKDYQVKYVNITCAKKFVQYIEKYIEKGDSQASGYNGTDINTKPAANDKKAVKDKGSSILDNTAIISTADNKGNVHGSVVHYVLDKDENAYFLTKSETTKVKNIQSNNKVALTIHPSDSLKVLYIEGIAEPISDKELKQQVFEHIVEPRDYLEGTKLPPITKLEKGNYIAYKITATDKTYIDYSEHSW